MSLSREDFTLAVVNAYRHRYGFEPLKPDQKALQQLKKLFEPVIDAMAAALLASS